METRGCSHDIELVALFPGALSTQESVSCGLHVGFELLSKLWWERTHRSTTNAKCQPPTMCAVTKSVAVIANL
jgi:hypothetical protein